MLLAPVAVLLTGILSFSMGLIFSVLTAKYRDVANLVGVGLRLMMFLTPVIYPLSSVKEGLRWVVYLNPLTPLFELFKLGLLGSGIVPATILMYSISFITISLVAALYLFDKQGNKLIDVV